MKPALIFSFLALTGICKAQFPEYYVYLVKGLVTVSGTNAKSGNLKQGDFVFSQDILSVSKNSEITLVDRDEKYVVINTPKTVKVSTLAANVSKSYPGVTKKYLHLVWEEVLDPNYDYTKFKKKNLTSVWGGVSRDIGCGNLIFPINGLKTAEDSIQFKWHQSSPSHNYTFLVYDGEGKEVIKMQVKDTQQIISGNQILQSKRGKYYWVIKSDDGTCEDQIYPYFELMTKDDEAKLVSSLVSNNADSDLLNQLQTIDKLEKNGLIYAASDHYSELAKANPDNIALRKSYVLFLLNYGFDNKALDIWK